MNIQNRLIFSVSLLFAVQGVFACDYPTRITLASGATATKEEMIESQKSVKNFVSEMEVYLACLLEEEKVARSSIEDLAPEDEQQREEMLNKKYNAAVEEMEKVAAQFNSEVQAYKGRNSS